MKQRKIVLLDGLPTAGKSTISYNLSKKLPDWIFIDNWRIKDMFEPLGYSNGMNKEEKSILGEISKKVVVMLTKEIIRNTERNIILQEARTKDVKRKLGRDLKKYNYKIYTVQLILPFKEAVKRSKSRDKPTTNPADRYTDETWEEKIKKKTKKGDIIIDTSKNNPEKVIKIILKAIGEKARTHPYESKIRRFW